MGQEIVAKVGGPLAAVLVRLGKLGCTVLMVDQQLHPPTAAVPDGWRELRLRLAGSAGMVTLQRREGAIAVVVFGNADARLLEAQRQIGEAISGPAAMEQP